MSTEQPALAEALQAALTAADHEVERCRRDQTQAQMVVAEAGQRLHDAERRLVEATQARNSISALLKQLADSTKGRPKLGELRAASERSLAPEPVEWVEAPQGQIMSPGFVATSNLSPAAIHAIEVLGAAPGPLRPADVLREFEAQGWVEPQWKTPAQSIYGALKRAEQSGMVSRNEDGRWQIAARAIAAQGDEEPEGPDVSKSEPPRSGTVRMRVPGKTSDSSPDEKSEDTEGG